MPVDATGPSRPTPLTVVIMAAGEGTRMCSAKPKVLHEIAGRSLVEHVVRACAPLDPDHLVVVAGHGRAAVETHLGDVAKDTGRTIQVAVQEPQRGTGHAVSCALSVLPPDLTGAVLVCNGDVPLLDTAVLAALLSGHDAGSAVTVLTAVVDDATGYGRIVRAADGSLDAIVEHRDATPEQLAINEFNAGMYVFDAEVLADALARLTPHNAQSELYLTDVVGIARGDGHRVGALVCPDPWLVQGVNDRVQLAAVGAEYNRRLVEGWMRAGVTVVDPATTWLDAGVELARDARIEPGVQLHGSTRIGEGATIGPDTTLTDTVVGAGAQVIRTHGSQAEIGPGASVGPFAYLRPGSVLGERGKIGTFVEVKNSQIGTGSKVPHLSYVGDATIGDYTNIGAASVFVNYDGVAKHRSVVGSHARTGSDNMFVAPVSVGDGAYTGAGAVIRRNVPPGALAVSGGPQRILDRWVLKHRQGTAAAEAAQRALDEQAGENEQAGTDTDGKG
ncbi:MAG TPA: bifunctional UDP-N-acetylglucosamine diphosphorylase/glucosamine-1-phosphate N-acetyltransferase GlmU [Actinophytocola sp.]|jgi:bifunctional UDP-N-acetylglucosamine pyrophosphorylase/glucosamine-1-phosphate N-acetyltransferase|uniref:bifunctional UDP-N-acetylglucosamine diphosphorylase/glucosamine-1-phosphate N-acetyltransferase GlmU n=1 Tax=Actinophytocola sp. TaxID=1872138 RepID=UPI002DFC34D5|nr:bifunctional UDP-N-acetylglucosamine diphosphorylase/glucosamine-1-phosphate N-acetyltransferase GlmU [Actinophytocola sp.]